jgi:hypothetical protein
MELVPTTISAGYACGLNAYGTVFLLGLLGRAGFGEVPDELTKEPILIAAGVMYAIEFVTDKVPVLDSTWDLFHTGIRPAIGGLVGVEFADLDKVTSAETIAVGGLGGSTALVAHGLKASIRLGINASPEPFSNIVASLVEDVMAAIVIALALKEPLIALAVVLVLLAIGIALAIFLHRRIKRAWRWMRKRWQARQAGAPELPPYDPRP